VENASFLTIEALSEKQAAFKPYALMHTNFVKRIMDDEGGANTDNSVNLAESIAEESYQINVKEARLIAATLQRRASGANLDNHFAHRSVDYDPFIKGQS